MIHVECPATGAKFVFETEADVPENSVFKRINPVSHPLDLIKYRTGMGAWPVYYDPFGLVALDKKQWPEKYSEAQ